MPLFDFKCCKCNEITERLIHSDIKTIFCERCGGLMEKILSMPQIMLDGTDPSLPGAYDKWARTREQRHRKNKEKSYYNPSKGKCE